MRTTAVFLSLAVLASLPGDAFVPPASAQYGPGARVWVQNDREYFRHGDRLRVNFTTSANSYVAVLHIDPSGNLDFVYPRSPWDNDFVRGGRVYSLDSSGWGNGLLVRGGSGIGYLYVIASPVPLDYSRFRAGPGSRWDWSYAGRSVYGDPFWAMEQITRTLLPRWGSVPYTVDYYTYFVGGLQRYPSYACANRYGGWGWGYSASWSSYYGSCDRLDYFLSSNPYYFDSRRFRGDRRSYYRDYYDERDWDPRHAFKVDPDRPAPRSGVRAQDQPSSGGAARVTPRPTETTRPSARPAQRAAPQGATGGAAQRLAPAQRTEARPRQGTPQQAQPAPAAQNRPQPRREESAPQRAQPAPAAQSRPQPRREQSAPQRVQPAPAAENRPQPRRAQPAPAPRPQARQRESQPQRSPSPRPEPQARSAPARDGGGSRSSSARSSRSSGSAERGSARATPRSRRDN